MKDVWQFNNNCQNHNNPLRRVFYFANRCQKDNELAPKLYHIILARVKSFCKYIFCVVFVHLARFLLAVPNASDYHSGILVKKQMIVFLPTLLHCNIAPFQGAPVEILVKCVFWLRVCASGNPCQVQKLAYCRGAYCRVRNLCVSSANSFTCCNEAIRL